MMSTARFNQKVRVLKVCWEAGDFIQDVDGYWYFWPSRNNGSWSSGDLVLMAELLDEANRMFEKDLIKYLESQREQDSPDFGEVSTDF